MAAKFNDLAAVAIGPDNATYEADKKLNLSTSGASLMAEGNDHNWGLNVAGSKDRPIQEAALSLPGLAFKKNLTERCTSQIIQFT